MATEAGDPWAVLPRERARYEEQFKSLNPVNGIITGQQARGFLCQSQLPVDVLGQIWGLADIDSDGRLDINEFSIACKLINLKLRGFPIPSTLPPILKSLTLQSPLVSSQPVKPPPPVIPPQPIIPILPVQPPALPPQPIIPSLPTMFAQPPVVQQQPILYAAEPIIPAVSRPSLTGLVTMPGVVPQPLIIPAQVTPVEAAGILDRRASIESQYVCFGGLEVGDNFCFL